MGTKKTHHINSIYLRQPIIRGDFIRCFAKISSYFHSQSLQFPHRSLTLSHHRSATSMPPAQPRNRPSSSATPSSGVKTPLNLDSFLNELTAMFERSTEKGSVWVTFKRSSLKAKVHKNKMITAGEALDFRCLIRAHDGKKRIATTVGPKELQRFQASYATVLKAHMTSLKKRERKDKRKAADSEKKGEGSKNVAASTK